MLRALIVIGLWAVSGAVPTLNMLSWTGIPDGSNRFLPFIGTADRMALDTRDSFLYVIGASSEQLHIIDILNHTHPTIVYSRTFSEITDGVPRAISFCRSGSREEVAIAFSAKSRLVEGHVEVFKPWLRFDQSFDLIGRVATESDPSAIKFDSACYNMVVACEGLPGSANNQFQDPLPHIDIFSPAVDGWTKITVNFIGARGLDQARYVFKDSGNPAHSVLNDLEPSDLIVDTDNTVYITFHENNVIAKFALDNIPAGIDFYSLGTKDWNNFDIDTSDRDSSINPGNINMVRRNIRSFHQPKRIDLVQFQGQSFLLTANTGGFKTYTAAVEGVDFNEASRARPIDDSLFDPSLDAGTRTDLNTDSQLGRLWVSTLRQESDGWDNIFGFFKHAYAYGARSWGMWNTNGITEVYDSGDSLEYQMSQYSSAVFNGDCSGSNTSPPQQLDTRSDEMGVEPTAIAHTTFNGNTLVAVGSGRSGGIWLYTIGEGEAPGLPTGAFNSYHRFGDINGNWRQLYDAGTAGVQHIQDLIFFKDSQNVDLLVALGSQMCAVAIFQVLDGNFP